MSSHMDFIKEQLYALTAIPSPSGFTKKATDYLLSELTALGLLRSVPEREMFLSHWEDPDLRSCWLPM